MAVNVTEAKTLAAADTGYVQNVIYANGVVTLPSTAAGLVFTVRNGGVPVSASLAGSGDDGNLISISPAALDLIEGGVTGTATDNKDLQNTAATARIGDEVTLMGGDADGWNVVSISGVWTREA
jgi:hypothetical protein